MAKKGTHRFSFIGRAAAECVRRQKKAQPEGSASFSHSSRDRTMALAILRDFLSCLI
jgi:hypothetical protein